MFKKLFGRNESAKPRVRICVECGMPVADHKDWCAIYRGQLEIAQRGAAGPAPTS